MITAALQIYISLIGILGVLNLTGGFRNITIQSAAQGFAGILNYLRKRNFMLSLPMLIASFVIGLYYFVRDDYFLGYGILLGAITSTLGNSWGVILSELIARFVGCIVTIVLIQLHLRHHEPT